MTPGTWTIPLSYLKPPLSLNGREHHMVRWRVGKEISGEVLARCQHAKLPKAIPYVAVTLHYLPASARRRDEDNLVATLKPCVDGLVAYGLVADDDSEHVTSRVVIGKPGQGAYIGRQFYRCWLEISEPGI
jgi:hypothetical protein